MLKIKNAHLDSNFINYESLLNSSQFSNDLRIKKAKGKTNIPKTSILLNTDENFRVKMPPVPILKSKGQFPMLTPFQKLELRRCGDKELIRRKVTMNKLEFFRKEQYPPEELKRKILLKRKIEDTPVKRDFINKSVSKVTQLPTLDLKRALDNPKDAQNFQFITERLKMESIQEFLSKEININPISTLSKCRNFSKNLMNNTAKPIKVMNFLNHNTIDSPSKPRIKYKIKEITIN
jgi:hypothetical protein